MATVEQSAYQLKKANGVYSIFKNGELLLTFEEAASLKEAIKVLRCLNA